MKKKTQNWKALLYLIFQNLPTKKIKKKRQTFFFVLRSNFFFNFIVPKYSEIISSRNIPNFVLLFVRGGGGRVNCKKNMNIVKQLVMITARNHYKQT